MKARKEQLAPADKAASTPSVRKRGRKPKPIKKRFNWADGRPGTRRFANEEAAALWLANAARTGEIQVERNKPDKSFDEALNIYLTTYRVFEKSPLATELKDKDARRFLTPVFSGKPLRAVTALALIKLREWIVDSSGTRAWYRVAAILRGIMKHAIPAWLSPNEDPFLGLPYAREPVSLLVATQKKAQARLSLPSRKQLRLMLSQARGYLRTALHIMIFAGLRRGELLALQWKHIILDTVDEIVEINVEQALKGDDSLGDPKTNAGKRRIQVDGELYVYLKSIHPGEAAGQDFVFTRTDGKLVPRFQLNSDLQAFQVSIGIGRRHRKHFRGCYTAHDFRHACVALWIWEGVFDQLMKIWIGHKSIATTLDQYAYLFDLKDAGLEEWPQGEEPNRINDDQDDREDDEYVEEDDAGIHEAAALLAA